MRDSTLQRAEQPAPAVAVHGTSAKLVAIALVAAVWLLMTAGFWMGYVGTDDAFYGRYAWLLHRPPINWWEFRIPAILAIRASFLANGPSEFAAAIPSLLASLAILASVAWFVRWPSSLNWRTNLSMVLAATVPLDVAFRSIPSANHIAAGLLAVGTVCLLRGSRRLRFLGAVLLAIGFVTHEVSFFYVALLCLTALAFDRHRFTWPVVTCVVVSGLAVILEGATYQALLGDAFARFRTSAATTTDLPIGYDAETGIAGVRFFTWPLEILIFSKAFGVDLILLLAGGALAWKRLASEQRILFVATFLTWAWLGYGSQVPWAYKPFYRQVHYYGPLLLGVAALLPAVVAASLPARRRLAQGIVTFAVLIHVVCMAGGGRWGEDFEVSRQLLRYASDHRDRVFVTDVATMNHMYTMAGFQLPENVVCLNGPAVERHLLVNKEPAGTPRFRFPEVPVEGVLVNLERLHQVPPEAEFSQYLSHVDGARTRVAPVLYRQLLAPLVAFTEPRDFMVRSLGGEVLLHQGRMPRSVSEEPGEAPPR